MKESRNQKLSCVILAAGLGTRMKSSLPKVMHDLMGKPMLHYCISAVSKLKPENIVLVVSKDHDAVKKAFQEYSTITFAVQERQRGTGHALITAWSRLKRFKGTILVLNGDSPLISTKTLKRFVKHHLKNDNDISMLSFRAHDPTSYGRILRNENGDPIRVVEEKDALPSQKKINEVNSGVYALKHTALPFLNAIRLNSRKGEYYLTDIVEIASSQGAHIGVYCSDDYEEFLGVNTRRDLSRARDVMKKKTLELLIENGVNFICPETCYVEPSVKIGSDTIIYPNVYLQGKTDIGKNCIVYPNVRVIHSKIKDGAVIKDSTLIESSVVGTGAQVGPFAHIRPDSEIGEFGKIGNFVEIKKTKTGKGTKAMHLSYIGDAFVGKRVNIGAGTITCNYDGKQKHRTVIEDDVFVGSDSQIVAPVKVGKGAYIGAGSTITKNVEPGSLAISRSEQKNIKGWSKKRKK